MGQDVFVQLDVDSSMDYVAARTNMLKQQIRTWGVTDDKILSLLYSIPREDFVTSKYKKLALADLAIPLSHGQSMMPPREEGRILQELQIGQDEKTLVLGIDSGYLVAVISKLAKQVLYLDNDLDSLEHVTTKLKQLSSSNVIAKIGNINQGWQDTYPFDVILLTGSLPTVPETLKNALTIGGRLFVVIGDPPAMEAMIITRLSPTTWNERKIFETDRPRMLDVKEPDLFEF